MKDPRGTDDMTRQVGGDTILDDIEALRMLWIKDDTTWNTAEVMGKHRKTLKPFSDETGEINNQTVCAATLCLTWSSRIGYMATQRKRVHHSIGSLQTKHLSSSWAK